MAQRSTVFRLEGIATGLDDCTVQSKLNAALPASGDATIDQLGRIGELRVVPSCDNERYSCALLNWKGDNDGFLSHLKKDSQDIFQLEVQEDDWTFDRHFFGFTQLYTPKLDHAVTADIVAITGLDGHAYGSFTGRGNLHRMWLRDFLLKDMPHCRTMIYGYDSKLSSRGIQTIMHYGHGFLEDLKKVRSTPEARKRPLFFIAHSFGGIVLAHCLINAALANGQDDEVGASLYKATYGVLFFGTPHKGMIVEDIRKVIIDEEDHPRNALLDQITANSNALISELSRFRNIIGDRKIVSFYEVQQTRRLVKEQEGGSWARTGSCLTAVEPDSAVLQLPDSMEVKIPINSDHSNMVKFDSRQDTGYTSALRYLKEFERDAPSVIAARFARTRSAPTPSSTVPVKRDDNFVGREETLKALWDILTRSDRHNRAALYGLGGVGKTQIAIEFSYRFREEYTKSWVFWVYASDATRFEQSFREIASRVELPGHNDPTRDMLQPVYRWLSNENNGRWLIILDNADDRDTFFKVEEGNPPQISGPNIGQASLASFLPQTRNGCILVTSQNKPLASTLIFGEDSLFQVGTMDELTAMSLFRTVLPSVEGDCMQLLHALDHLPLAIVQAAAHIKERAPRITIAKYLQLLADSKAPILDVPIYNPRRDQGLPVSVFATWKISYDQIRRQSPPAAELFDRMSVLDRQAIPGFLLHDDKDEEDDNDNFSETFENALAPLLAFSLLTEDSRGHSFSMHRLVQCAGRKWLASESDQLRKTQDWVVQTMARAFPPGDDHQDREKCRLLLPHVNTVLEYSRSGEREVRLCGGSIAHDCAWYLWKLGTYEAASEMNRRALDVREQELGTLDPDTLDSMNNLAVTLDAQNEYEASEVLYRQALKLSEEKLGPSHLDTSISISNLAQCLYQQGQYDNSEALTLQALKIKEQHLGRTDLSTLDSVSHLAIVLQAKGKYPRSEILHREVLAGRERLLDSLHRDILTSLANLGMVLQLQGQHELSEELNLRALKGREQELGPLHPDTLDSVHFLATNLHYQGKYEEAEQRYRRALEGTEQQLGPLHVSTLRSVWGLARLLSDTARNQEARSLFQRACAGFMEVLGADHPDTRYCMRHAGEILPARRRRKRTNAHSVAAPRPVTMAYPEALVIRDGPNESTRPRKKRMTTRE